MKNKYLFLILLFFFVIFLFFYIKNSKKEGLINGRVIARKIAGKINHSMSPAVINSAKRNIRTSITNAFSNPDVNYYTSKLYQIFK